MCPMRPHEQITSSEISSTPWRSQISRTPGSSRPGAEAAAAVLHRLEDHRRHVSGPANSIASSIASAAHSGSSNTRRVEVEVHNTYCSLPPVGRIMALNRVQEILLLDGEASHPLEFSVNQFRNVFHPRGCIHICGDSCSMMPSQAGNMRLKGFASSRNLQLIWHANVCGVRFYTVEAVRPDRKVQLQLLPMTGLCDFHAERHGADQGFKAEASESAVFVSTNGYDALHVASDNGRFVEAPDWWYGQVYAIETDRGQDDNEDLFTPGRFIAEGTGRLTVTLWASTDAICAARLGRRSSPLARGIRRGVHTSGKSSKTTRSAIDHLPDRFDQPAPPGPGRRGFSGDAKIAGRNAWARQCSPAIRGLPTGAATR